MKDEPQSYGSNADWLTGKTGQSVDRTQEKTDRTDEEFYDSRHKTGAGGKTDDRGVPEGREDGSR